MRTYFGFLFVFVLGAIPAAKAQSLKDTLYFNNGSVIVGKVKSIALGMITFKPDDANEIRVQLRKLKTIHTMSRLYRLETVKHTVYYAYMAPDSEPGYVRLEGPADTPRIHLRDISGMMPLENSFFKKLSATFGAGYSYTRTSDLGRLNVDANAKYLAKDIEFGLTISTIATIDSATYKRDRENVTLNFNYYFSPTWFTGATLSYQRNMELGIQRRYQEGIGIGNKFIVRNRVNAWAMSGFVLNQEKSTAGTSSKTLAELFGQVQFNFFKFSKPAVDLNFRQTFFAGLGQGGRVRNDGQTTLSWEIVDDLKLNISLYNNYDSHPPVADSRKFDYGYVFGVSYTFN